ncbi:hypothetical protein F5J12DRAFT_936555 [Pisolithus orientalis]|uniref:uncharacterized protein n=1 Tax=Pisolithus orientalis TaxID=936130 RepID=UPI0022245AAB|nr:uncharacterized protein F5J12DRAFT_936555 [Pisolithus orientalis]KAI6008102.1 hypothetical protein F5J12DRAFT_936555 [Pisolithus orientalis]
MDTITSQLKLSKIKGKGLLLDLPLITVEYKKTSGSLVQAMNQLRMYLTALVKFLQAMGVMDFPVYGVEANGSVVSLPVAVLQSDENIVHLFEWLVEKLDISSPLGAWHYATILCKLTTIHAGVLEGKFEDVEKNLIMSLLNNRDTSMGEWTITDRFAMLAVSHTKGVVDMVTADSA